MLGGCWAAELESGDAHCLGPREERTCVRPGSAQAHVLPRAGAGPAPGASGATGTSGGSGTTGASGAPGASGATGGRPSTPARPAGSGAPLPGADNPTPSAGSPSIDEPVAPPPPAPSAVLVGHVVNARDLGGVPLAGSATVAEGALFRGPPLAPLTDAGCRELEQLGIRTIIDLRVDSEWQSKPDADCAQQQARVVHAPLPIPYSVSTQDYITDLHTHGSIALAFEALGDPDAYPIYFHCTWGRDRTGVLASVILLALGADRDDILDEYLLSLATVGAYPQSLEGMLDELELGGGVEAYLESAGVPAEAVETLRSRAILTIP